MNRKLALTATALAALAAGLAVALIPGGHARDVGERGPVPASLAWPSGVQPYRGGLVPCPHRRLPRVWAVPAELCPVTRAGG